MTHRRPLTLTEFSHDETQRTENEIDCILGAAAADATQTNTACSQATARCLEENVFFNLHLLSIKYVTHTDVMMMMICSIMV